MIQVVQVNCLPTMSNQEDISLEKSPINGDVLCPNCNHTMIYNNSKPLWFKEYAKSIGKDPDAKGTLCGTCDEVSWNYDDYAFYCHQKC